MNGVELFRFMILAEELRTHHAKGRSIAILSVEYRICEDDVRYLIEWRPDGQGVLHPFNQAPPVPKQGETLSLNPVHYPEFDVDTGRMPRSVVV